MGGNDRPPKAVRFEAIEVGTDDGDDGQLVFWCPWCEALHYHGACGGGGQGDGHRVAHCVGDRRSPLIAGGVELVTAGQAATSEAVQPDAPMVSRPPLRSMLWHYSGEFRTVVLRALFGIGASKARGLSVGHSIKGKAGVLVYGRASWNVLPKEGDEISGRGFLRLASLLYGLPAGVVAVRLLEEISAETFDAATALAIQEAVDAWVSCGAPERERSSS